MNIRLRMRWILTGLMCAVAFGTMAQVRVDILPEKQYQTMAGFGASDCWTMQYVGKYWAEAEKEKAARLLFSTEMDAGGSPRGIGLSIWRFNLGAGTIEQGDSGKIKDITRRAESFLNERGEFDFSKQAGQQWFLDKARKYGCHQFVAFSNSPPVCYTRNGKGFAPKDGNANLREDSYDDFAGYMVTVLDYFKQKKGIDFKYISPVNEPQWPWNGTYQEGSPWQTAEIKKLAVELDKALQRKKSNTKIILPEAGHWSDTYRAKERASNMMYELFDTRSANYVGDLKTVARLIAGHSYWTDSSNAYLTDVRRRVKAEADKYGLKVHQTEWSLLSKMPLEDMPDSFGKATYTDIALFMAKVMYADLVIGGASEWSFWTAMDAEQWGFKNRYNLLRMHTTGGDYAPATNGGTVSDVKTLWVLGNYSRFVRPGYKRIETTPAGDLSGLMCVSFLSPDGRQIVSVLTNNSLKPTSVQVGLSPRYQKRVRDMKCYLTDKEHNLSKTDVALGKLIELPAKSVTTVVYQL